MIKFIINTRSDDILLLKLAVHVLDVGIAKAISEREQEMKKQSEKKSEEKKDDGKIEKLHIRNS